MTPAHPPDAVVTDPIQQALAAVDGPVPTRAHREMAITIYWAQPDYREIPCGNDYVERGNMRGIDPRVQRFALALATIEHKARRGAEPKWVAAAAELPDSDVRVLVRGTDGDIVSAELEFTDDSEGHGEPYWAAGDCGDLSFCNYPHWMPRPADPPSDV